MFKIYVPSLGREGRQITLSNIPKAWEHRVILACPKSEKHDWFWRMDIPESCVGSISKTRQYIMENAQSDHLAMCDDDVSFYVRSPERKLSLAAEDQVYRFFTQMERWLEEGYVFGGATNRFMSNQRADIVNYGPPSHLVFMNRKWMAEKKIRYDAISTLEDFHVPLSALENGGRLIYDGNFIAQEWKANAPGGCSLTRTAAESRGNFFNLAKLHPRYVKVHEVPGKMSQNLQVDAKCVVQWKKAYEEKYLTGSSLDEFI